MPREMTTTQLEVFPNIPPTPVALIPPRQSLPGDTRQTLTRLMTRLIAKHAGAAEGETIMKHEKIGPLHLERKAIFYVRQSSAHQVLHNRESSTLQYAIRERLSDLGWNRIETVDDDLGRSAAGGIAQAGFDRMIADVCLGKVGAVAAREVSRFHATAETGSSS